MGTTTVVLDTNTLVSAFGWNNKPEQCLRLAMRGEIELAWSPEAAEELVRVLQYDRIPIEDDKVAFYFGVVQRFSTVIVPDVDITDCDDPDDNMFLECAVAGDAEYIVSGDPHLTDLHPYEGIQILPPAEFLDEQQ